LGIPQTLVSDNGTQYAGFLFEEFAKKWNFQHVTSSPQYPKSNGMVERAIQTVKNIIKKCIESKTELELALLDYRNTPVDYCVLSPCELFFNRKLRTLIPIQNKL
jgi:transposase InsO family protein